MADYGVSGGEQRRILQLCKGCHRTNPQAAIFGRTNSSEVSIEMAKADKTRGLKQACLHHQHERGANRNGAHTSIFGIEKIQSFFQRTRFQQFEGLHELAFMANPSIADLKFEPNCCETSALFARNTGSPRPPSLPARLTLEV